MCTRREHLPDEGYQVGANEDIETNPNHLLCCEENVGCVEGEHPLQLCTPLLAVGGAGWCEGEGEGGKGGRGIQGRASAGWGVKSVLRVGQVGMRERVGVSTWCALWLRASGQPAPQTQRRRCLTGAQ